MQHDDDQQKRYDLFGWDVAEINPISEEEAAWYLDHAKSSGGPVLDLACGTGRLLCKMAEEGYLATGVDLSPTMMRIARENIAALPDDARCRARLVRADMTQFALGERFGLIYIADNSFRVLTEREQHVNCLRCVVDHLRDDGVFLMTERRFDAARFGGAIGKASDWTEPVRHPETGDMVQRRYELRVSDDGKWIEGRFVYRIRSGDGSERTETCPILAPVMTVADYQDLFTSVGLVAEVFCGYAHVPDDGKDPLLCFVCRKA